jgi:hypothetical protein
MNIKLKTVGSIKIKGNPKTRSSILQTFQKVFGTPINGFSRIEHGTVMVLFHPQQQVELTKFTDQFLGKIKKGNYFFDEIDTPKQKLELLFDIGEPLAIGNNAQAGGYEASIYPNQQTTIYVNAKNKH